VEHCQANEQAAARASLQASAYDWKAGAQVAMVDWIRDRVDDALPVAERHGFRDRLEPIEQILEGGNLAQRWLALVDAGNTPRSVIRRSIVELTEIDRQYDPECPSPVAARPIETEPSIAR